MLNKANMAALIATDAIGNESKIRQYTLTVNTAADDTDYVFAITVGSAPDDATITYTVNSGTGATTASIAGLIRTALSTDANNDGGGVMGDFVGEGGGAGATAVIEGLVAGTWFTVTESDANMSVVLDAAQAFDTTAMEKSLNAIIGNVFTPAALTGDVDNYDPPAVGGFELLNSTMIRIDGGGANRNITGIVPYHRMLILVNITAANTLILKHETTSSVANRFALTGAADRVLGLNEAVVLVYDPTASRWRTAS